MTVENLFVALRVDDNYSRTFAARRAFTAPQIKADPMVPGSVVFQDYGRPIGLGHYQINFTVVVEVAASQPALEIVICDKPDC